MGAAAARKEQRGRVGSEKVSRDDSSHCALSDVCRLSFRAAKTETFIRIRSRKRGDRPAQMPQGPIRPPRQRQHEQPHLILGYGRCDVRVSPATPFRPRERRRRMYLDQILFSLVFAPLVVSTMFSQLQVYPICPSTECDPRVWFPDSVENSLLLFPPSPLGLDDGTALLLCAAARPDLFSLVHLLGLHARCARLARLWGEEQVVRRRPCGAPRGRF